MKKLLTLIVGCISLFHFSAHTQYLIYKTKGVFDQYVIANFARYGNYNVISIQKVILSSSSGQVDQTLSTWQKLPFSFNYFGKSVSGYYASDNGYITFDSTATSSLYKNDSLPSVKAPKNAILAFWQDLALQKSDTNYKYMVRTWTYGNAPHRVHVIQWFGPKDAKTTDSFYNKNLFFSIRLFECGDFDILQDYKGTSAGKFAATIGCTSDDGKLASQVAGSPNLDFPLIKNGNFDNPSYVVYKFIDKNTPYDISITSIDSIRYSYKQGDKVNFSGTLKNTGSTTLTSLKLFYRLDSSAATIETFSSLNIPPNSTYNYKFGTSYSAISGLHIVSIGVLDSSLNGSNADIRSCNNIQTQKFIVSTNGKNIITHPLVEYYNGAWGGYNVDGDSAAAGISNTFAGASIVAIHGPYIFGLSNDQMMLKDADPIRNLYNPAYPTAIFSRTIENLASQRTFSINSDSKFPGGSWIPYYKSSLATYSPVDVKVSSTYNKAKKTADITVKANFEDYTIPGDIRITLYLVEDSLSGKGAGWDQHNYFYNTPGSPFYKVGTIDPNNSNFSWIKGYKHNFVLRKIMLSDSSYSSSPTWGDSGIIPRSPVPGTMYKTTYTSVDISSYNPNNLKIIAFVNYHNNFNPLIDDSSILERTYVLNSSGSIPLLYSGMKDIKGTVSTSTGAALKTSEVYLCTYKPSDSSIHVTDSMITDTNGHYSFQTNDSIVYILAFPKANLYPTELPTWADSGAFFMKATAIKMNASTVTKNFNTRYGTYALGTGFIGGKVGYCTLCKTFGSGVSAVKVRIMLADSNGKVLAYNFTDNTGSFSFNGISLTKYKILVDMPMIDNSNAPSVSLSIANSNESGLKFTLYPTYLSLSSTSAIENSTIDDEFNIYPNPVFDKLIINLNPAYQNGKINITDISGKEFISQYISALTTGIDVSSLPSGMYLLHYQNKNISREGKFMKE